jgi:hypothetical protein
MQHCLTPYYSQLNKLSTHLPNHVTPTGGKKVQLLKHSTSTCLLQVLSCLPPSTSLTGQNFHQPSHIINTFLLPSYSRIHLNYSEWPWKWRTYVSPKGRTSSYKAPFLNMIIINRFCEMVVVVCFVGHPRYQVDLIPGMSHNTNLGIASTRDTRGGGGGGEAQKQQNK